MTTQILCAPPVVLSSGVFSPGAQLYFYESGTTTLLTVYTDTGYTTPHDSPVEADGAGNIPAVYYSGASEVKIVIEDADDTTVTTIDPAPKVSSTGSAAGSIAFAPVTGNAATDVQTAIENNTAARTGRSTDVKNFLGSVDQSEMRTNLAYGSAADADLVDNADLTVTPGSIPTRGNVEDNLPSTFRSSAQSLTTAGALLTMAHGLSAEPDMVLGTLECIVADRGFSIGDRVQVEFNNQTGTSARGHVLYKDASNIYVRLNSAAPSFWFAHKTTGAAGFSATSRWELYVTAVKF